MPTFHWFLPTGGDGRDVVPGSVGPARPPSLDYLAQVALAAEQLGFDALLTPCGTGCEDAWITTAMLIGRTTRIRFLVAFRPGLLSPTLAAQMASTYQRLSGGRVLLNLVTGAEAAELARFGDHLDKDDRYARTGEFIEVLRGAWRDEPFTFRGTHYDVADATTRVPPRPTPPIYFGGASAAAEEVAAAGADVYLAWGETPDMLAERLERMRTLAAAHDRDLRYGVRFHVITRPTAAEAWAVAEALLETMDPAEVRRAQAELSASASEGQRRMAALHGGDPDRLVIHPNVWAGIGLVRGGAGTALVGSHAEVADRIAEYHALGLEDFILSGYPHLEEAWWFGEGVLPLLRERGLAPPLPADAPAAGPGMTFR